MVAKVDEELKKLSISYNEKSQAVSAVLRKKATNFATSDFEDFLPADVVSKNDFLNTEFLLTVAVIVPASVEAGKEYSRS